MVASPYFTTSVYDMTEEITCDYSELDSFVIFICVEGSCRLTDDNQNEITLRAGETVAFACCCSGSNNRAGRRESETA